MKTAILTLSIVILGCATSVQAQPNTLTSKEVKDGWKLLFDGKTTNGWRNYNEKGIGEAWKVVDGALYLDNTKVNGKDVKGGNLVTENVYENYEFSVEWKISKCGNSGILFNVVEDPKVNEPYLSGPEMQIIDNPCHDDGKIDKHRAGDLYDLIEGPRTSVKPAEEWNLAVIISNKGHLELWQNGVKQVETTMFTPEWDAMIKGSKFKSMPLFGKSPKGRISLQDHGNPVSFRNIKIREIK